MKMQIFILAGAGTNPNLSTSRITEALVASRHILEPLPNPMKSLRAWLASRQWLSERVFRLTHRLEDRFQRSDELRRPFFQWLLDVSHAVYPGVYSNDLQQYRPLIQAPTFEDLIYTIERLPYLLQSLYNDSVWETAPPFEKPFFRLSKLGALLKSGQSVNPFDLQIWATNFVLDYVAAAVLEEKGQDAYDLIESLHQDAHIALFSLNYDSSIINLERSWWTSFRSLGAEEAKRHDSAEGVQIFESQPDIPAETDAFIQLHGSTHFGWIAHPYRAPVYVPSRSALPRNVKRSTPRRNGFEQWNDRTALPATLMITGYRKGEKVLIEPYASYYHYFRDEAYRSPYWLILGYGGRDPHINAVLTSASDYWGKNLRAYVCNHGDALAASTNERMRNLAVSKVGYLGANARELQNGPFRVSSPSRLDLGSSVRLSLDASTPLTEMSFCLSFRVKLAVIRVAIVTYVI